MRNCMMKRSTLQIWVQGNVVSSGFLCVQEMILIHITQGEGGVGGRGYFYKLLILSPLDEGFLQRFWNILFYPQIV